MDNDDEISGGGRGQSPRNDEGEEETNDEHEEGSEAREKEVVDPENRTVSTANMRIILMNVTGI